MEFEIEVVYFLKVVFGPDSIMSIISVDDEFSSYEEVEEKIQHLQDTEKFKLWKRDSRTIAAAIKRMPKRVFNPEVKYNELLYCCVYGGRETKDELRSMRQRCPYQIKFRCTQDGQRLRVVSITPNHNHGPAETPVEMDIVESKVPDQVGGARDYGYCEELSTRSGGWS